MYIGKILDDGVPVSIIVPDQTEERLQSTCYRGNSFSRAGNFLHWWSSEGLLRDPELMLYFLEELNQLWSEQAFGTRSVCIVHSDYVGWESTSPLALYEDEDLEVFQLNRRAHALRVKLDCTHLLAPLTKEVTIVFEFKEGKDRTVAIVHSAYPGFDVGDLSGDVTEREHRVFFDWNHPGM